MFIELIKVIENIEEFFLGLFFADDKLKVINNKTIEFFKFTIKIFTLTILDGVDKVGIEMGNWCVKDFIVRIVFKKFVANSLNKVGFAEAWSTIKKEWVTASARVFNNAFSGGNGDIIIATNDKTV